MYNVLIVEDDPMVAMINEQYVSRNKGFHVSGTCHDGASALDFIENNDVDLIILDVYMPIMNGIEMLREARRRELEIAAIMVTAANDATSLEECMKMGIIDYLVKPFTFDRFQQALNKFISRMEAFENHDGLNQNTIDRIIGNTADSTESIPPKGIQKRTEDAILDILRETNGTWLSGDDIAARTGLSSVTVRRYMAYLAHSGDVIGTMNYETGGRPCMLYKINK